MSASSLIAMQRPGPEDTLIDTATDLATAEGCSLTLRRAGLAARSVAWLIDLGVRAVIFIVCAFVLSFMKILGMGSLLLVSFGLEWIYPLLFEMLMNGSTPGKRAMRLMVINDNGTPLTWSSSTIRNLARAVDFLPLLYGTALCTMLLGDGSKRLGDWLAGTVVVYRDDTLVQAHAGADAAAEAPGVPLTVDEQRTLIDYVRRDGELTVERSQELAACAVPLVAAEPPAGAREHLLAIGRYLLGAG